MAVSAQDAESVATPDERSPDPGYTAAQKVEIARSLLHRALQRAERAKTDLDAALEEIAWLVDHLPHNDGCQLPDDDAAGSKLGGAE